MFGRRKQTTEWEWGQEKDLGSYVGHLSVVRGGKRESFLEHSKMIVEEVNLFLSPYVLSCVNP